MSVGHRQRNLPDQIKSAARSYRRTAAIHPPLAYSDMIRIIGNLAAHPSERSFEIQYEDAEWCLEMVEELFDFFYEKPLEFEQRMMELQGRWVHSRPA
jgi:hypothetical protein